MAAGATAETNPDGIRTPAATHPDTTACASAVTDAVVMLVVPPPVVSSPSATNAVASDWDISELPIGSSGVPPSVGPCRAAPTVARSRVEDRSPLSEISAGAAWATSLHAAISAWLVSVPEPPAAADCVTAGVLAAAIGVEAGGEVEDPPHAAESPAEAAMTAAKTIVSRVLPISCLHISCLRLLGSLLGCASRSPRG
jgi:hypothetical protein